MPALERLKPMPYANMLVQRRAGRVTAYAAGVNEGHGHGQFPEKYAKFAYDTRFGFCASRSREVLNQAAPDSMLAFVIDDNVFVRKVSKTWEIEAGAVTAQWSPFPGIEVTTTITPTATASSPMYRWGKPRIFSAVESSAAFSSERRMSSICLSWWTRWSRFSGVMWVRSLPGWR